MTSNQDQRGSSRHGLGMTGNSVDKVKVKVKVKLLGQGVGWVCSHEPREMVRLRMKRRAISQVEIFDTEERVTKGPICASKYIRTEG